MTPPCVLASWNLLLGLLQQPSVLLQQPLDTLRIYAVGDINLGGRITSARLMAGDTLYPFRALLDTLRAAHITFGNLESPIAADSGGMDSTGFVFTAPGLAAEALRQAGFDIVSTANNHMWDGGQPGVIETMRRLSEAGVLFVGSGIGREMAQQPVIVRRNGWRVAFFAITRAWNPAPTAFHRHEGARYVAWGDTAWIHPAIARLKAERRADLIVVSVHAGPEFADTAPTYHRKFLEGLVDAGADLVLAHHPHVLQPVVRHRGKPIAQSLGNFIFYQFRPWANLSAILRVVVTPNKQLRVSAVPVRAGPQAELAEGAAADSVRRRLKIRR